jgi:nucleotide-binding universal stress UspA family protein
MSYRQVLLGTDGSKTAGQAAVAAARVAVALEVPLVVVTAWTRDLADPPPASEESRYPGGNAASQESHWAVDVTSDTAAQARALGVAEVRQVQPIGSPGHALVEVAERYPEALLVVGTAGLDDPGERLVGNVPHHLTHHSPIDLLLVGRGPDADRGWANVGLATDGSDTAVTAARRGLALATALDTDALLLTVARDEARGADALRRTAAALDGDGADLEARVATGSDVARTLVAAARDLDLLVLGNRGMVGAARLLGSVANRVTHEVPTDLLLVNTTA